MTIEKILEQYPDVAYFKDINGHILEWRKDTRTIATVHGKIPPGKLLPPDSPMALCLGWLFEQDGVMTPLSDPSCYVVSEDGVVFQEPEYYIDDMLKERAVSIEVGAATSMGTTGTAQLPGGEDEDEVQRYFSDKYARAEALNPMSNRRFLIGMNILANAYGHLVVGRVPVTEDGEFAIVCPMVYVQKLNPAHWKTLNDLGFGKDQLGNFLVFKMNIK